MRKRFLSIVALLTVLCIALVGCGGGAPQEEKDIAANFYGEWEYIAAEGDDPIDEESAADMKELGLTFKIILAEDGTWAFTAVDDEVIVSGTWEAQSETEATLTSSVLDTTSTATFDPETGHMRYDNGSGMILVLEHIGDAATAPVASYTETEGSDSGSGGKIDSGGSTSDEPESADYNAQYVGDWELVEMTADDPEDAIDADTVAQLKDAGYVATLTLAEDGTFTLDVFGDSEMTGTWSFESETAGIIVITSDGSTQHSPLEYDPSTGRLAVIESSDALYFARV
ncbi:MAG: hypothetical protein K5859_10770 [Atopobiaceae bacterium]|nr:hypothetical protein [Atopobiaceae bacterium]